MKSASSVEMTISIFVIKTEMSNKRSLLDTQGSLTPREIHVIYFHVVAFLLNPNEDISNLNL